MIIVSDAHLDESAGNQGEFFRMLQCLEKKQEDLVFLGDIFDLWIALPRYESEAHRRFLSWCGRQKEYRRIGFVEGNHEYFLAQERSRFFTWCSDGPFMDRDLGYLFCHGDQINRLDKNYLRFRKLAKNRLTKSALQVMPLGPEFVAHVKARLRHTNLEFRRRLPWEELDRFARRRFASGDRIIFVGHFHQAHQVFGPGGRTLLTVPSWFGDGVITRFDVRTGAVVHDKWPALLN